MKSIISIPFFVFSQKPTWFLPGHSKQVRHHIHPWWLRDDERQLHFPGLGGSLGTLLLFLHIFIICFFLILLLPSLFSLIILPSVIRRGFSSPCRRQAGGDREVQHHGDSGQRPAATHQEQSPEYEGRSGRESRAGTRQPAGGPVLRQQAKFYILLHAKCQYHTFSS